MKPPKEIKKGLTLCSHEAHGAEIICNHCPYDYNGSAFLICTGRLAKDALDYIQQLESRLAQVEKENKAMFHDMARYTMCGACKHFANREQCPQHDECVYGEIGHFEWRGVCAENTEADDNA